MNRLLLSIAIILNLSAGVFGADETINGNLTVTGSTTLNGVTATSGTISGSFSVNGPLAVSTSGGVSGLDYIDARWYGVDSTGAADSTTQLNNAITAAVATKRALLVPGVVKISSTLAFTSPIMVYGDGSTSTIKWAGASGGTVMTVSGVGRGFGISDLVIDANNAAANGVILTEVTFGYFKNLRVTGFTTGTGLKVTSATGNSAWNTFINLIINGNSNGYANLWLESGGASNSCLNTFVNTHLTHAGTRNAIVLGDCDTNSFIDTFIFRSEGGTGAGVLVVPPGSNPAGRPQGNVFTRLGAGPGGWVQPSSTASAPATIFGYQRSNGEPLPVTNGSQGPFLMDEWGQLVVSDVTSGAITASGSITAPEILAQNPSASSVSGVSVKAFAYPTTYMSAALVLGDSSAAGSMAGVPWANTGGLYIQNADRVLIGTNSGTAPIIFATGGAERFRIDAAGVASSSAGFRPPHMTDAAAANDTIYFSTTQNKLVYKYNNVANPLY